MRSLLPVLLAAATFVSCGDGPKTAGLEALNTRVVTLPDGRQIRAEVMINPAEVSRGMMFRDYNRFLVNDWWRHGLNRPVRGMHWVQRGNVFLLVNARGIVVDVVFRPGRFNRY